MRGRRRRRRRKGKRKRRRILYYEPREVSRESVRSNRNAKVGMILIREVSQQTVSGTMRRHRKFDFPASAAINASDPLKQEDDFGHAQCLWFKDNLSLSAYCA